MEIKIQLEELIALKKKVKKAIKMQKHFKDGYKKVADILIGLEESEKETIDWKKKWSVAVSKQVEPKVRPLSEVCSNFGMTDREVCDIIYGKDSTIYNDVPVTQDEWMFLGGYAACQYNEEFKEEIEKGEAADKESAKESAKEADIEVKETKTGWHSMSYLPVKSDRNPAFSETVELLTVNDTLIKGFFYLTEDSCRDLTKGLLTTYDSGDKEITNIDQKPSGFRKWRYIYKSGSESEKNS